MNNLLSFRGLVDARISASEKYLPACRYFAKRHGFYNKNFEVLTLLLKVMIFKKI
jgi:hypothetical protein